MNFAQLIDPEWVLQGCPERFPRQRPAQQQPLRVVTHDTDLRVYHQAASAQPVAAPAPDPTRPERLFARTPIPRGRHATGTSLAMMRVLAAARREISAAEVIARMGADAPPNDSSVSAMLSVGCGRGEVERVGERRPFKFRITELGRSRVP